MSLNKHLIKQYSIRNSKLKSNGFDSYNQYLKSEKWKSLKDKWEEKRTKNKFWNQCNICKSSDNLVLHHLRYNKICKDILNCIIPVCMSCHGKIHELAHNSKELSIKEATNIIRKQYIPCG